MKKLTDFIKLILTLLFSGGRRQLKTVVVKTKKPITAGKEVISDAADLPEDEIEEAIKEEIEEQPKHVQKYLWVLGAGHGKNTTGKRSPKENGKVLLYEWEYNRQMVALVKDRLDELGIANALLVDDSFTDNFYKKRIERLYRIKATNELPVIYLSFHGNAHGGGKWSPASGIETWYQTRNRKSRKLASIFQRSMMLKNGAMFKDRGIRSWYPLRKSFYVLRNSLSIKVPAILFELGFFTNREEVDNMLNEDVQKKLAWSIVDAIVMVETNKKWEDVQDYKTDRELTPKEN